MQRRSFSRWLTSPLDHNADAVAFLLADGLSNLGLDGKHVRPVAQRHQRALERVAIDGPANLDETSGSEHLHRVEGRLQISPAAFVVNLLQRHLERLTSHDIEDSKTTLPPDGASVKRLDYGGRKWLDIAMKHIKIAELKDRLSEHLRAVEKGAEVVVTDRTRPIARIVPFEKSARRIRIVAPRRDFSRVRGRRYRPANWRIDSTQLLLEERGER